MHKYSKMATAVILFGLSLSMTSRAVETQKDVADVATLEEGNPGLLEAASSEESSPTSRRDPSFKLTDAVDGLEEVAKVNNRSILMHEVAEPLARLRLPYVEAPDKVKYLLDQIITNELLAQEAVRLGIDKDPRVAEQLQASKRKIIATTMDEKLRAETSKNQLIRYYTQHPEEFRSLKIAQILVSDEAQANDLYKQLSDDGADFAALAKQYSQDEPIIKDKGGELGFLGRGMAGRALENMAYALETGEVSTPVSTGLGYHIIKLLESKEPTRFNKLTPAEINGIKTHIFNNKMEKIEATASIVKHPERLAILSLPAEAQPDISSSAPQAQPESSPKILASVNGEAITTEEFINRLGKVNVKLIPYYSTPTGKLEFLDQLIAGKLLYQEGMRLKLDQDVAIQDQLIPQERAILTAAMKAKIEKEKQSEEQLKTFYNAHPHDFRTVQIAHIQVEELEDAKAVSKALQEGGDFAKLAEQHSTDTVSRTRGGVLGSINVWSDIDRSIQDTALALDVNQVSEPTDSKFGYQIIKVLEAKDPTPFEKLTPAQHEAIKSQSFRSELDQLVKNSKIEISQQAIDELIAVKKQEDQNRSMR